MGPIIRVENLGKQYRIGARRLPYETLRDTIVGTIRAPFERLRGNRKDQETTVWALDDISFDVRPGEVVGVIGRNGAGKSTLLKIISRITRPSRGRVHLYGRVGSLLEVGTGFHPELTGRENIFLSSAILGMKKHEVARKFDEIVAFAGTEKFLDTPVKHYSSGMYVRLAFAVAAHLQPEILLIDEVLAVGDIEFQRKCIGRMEEIATEGRTVLVVSHNMSSVKALCTRAILLDAGRVETMGPVDDVVDQYLKTSRADPSVIAVTPRDHRHYSEKMYVRRIELMNPVSDGFAVYWKQPITISLHVDVLTPLTDVAFGAGIRGLDGTHVFTIHHDDDATEEALWSFEPGEYNVTFTIENDLRPGMYKLHLGADEGHHMFRNLFGLDVVTFEVLGYSESGRIPEPSNTGILNGRSTWLPPRPLTLASQGAKEMAP